MVGNLKFKMKINYVISTIGNKANGKNYFFKKLIINKLVSHSDAKNNIIDEINNYFLDNSEGIKLFLPLNLDSYMLPFVCGRTTNFFA